ncbi:MAG: efflux RND transporter permease subunit [Archangium sp.]|nr:efflux RND transporter permease subunit [Archangium sp.]
MLRALLAVVAFVVIGIIAVLMLAQYRLEHVRFTEELAVTVVTPGLSVAEAEREVTERLEQALSDVKGLESLRSTTKPGVVVINVRATTVGLDSTDAVVRAHEAVSRTLRELPPHVEAPYVQRLDANPQKKQFLVRAETMSRIELSRWLDDVLRHELEVQAGVREVKTCGALEPQLRITLDPARLTALGLPAEEVVNALQHDSVNLPSGRLDATGITVRAAGTDVEALQNLVIRDGVRLNEVAQLEVSGDQGSCTTLGDILLTVVISPGTGLLLPDHAAVKLMPLQVVRAATFLSPAGNSVNEAMRALSNRYPGATVTAEGDTLSLLFVEEPKLAEVPGLALRSVDELHSVVQVSGPDFEQLTEVAQKLRGALAVEKTRWLGVAWPQLGPEQVIKAEPGAKGLATALRLAMGGVTTGRLADGTQISVHAGSSLDDAVLPDGRPVRSVMTISQTLAPTAMLRVNRQRTVELEVGLERAEAERVVKSVALPPGYAVTVSEVRPSP